MHTIEFRETLLHLESKQVLLPWFRECTPKVLVVTDGLSFSGASAFGLTQFIATLASSTIHGMTPQVIKASRGSADPNADLKNFKFDDAANGLKKSRYDVVFLFGIAEENTSLQLPQSEIDAVARFMQAGGGVFATGDHEDLGAAMGRDVPRVRAMRFWRQSETPNVMSTTRLSTNLSGANDQYEFEDQSDTNPQRLYVNYRTAAGGVGRPHPLLQFQHRAIEVFPDHPHEGECRVPSALNTIFQVDGAPKDEWPTSASGTRVAPEMVARTMSHGNEFDFQGIHKQALVPRDFMSIVAYDGQRANVGRVVTDATWHHFVNVNIDGTGSGRAGMQDPPGTDTPEMQRIRQYYRNLAAWLMPRNARLCLRIPWLLEELRRFPLYEELRLPHIETATGDELHAVGEAIAATRASRGAPWEGDALVRDSLEDAVGAAKAEELETIGARHGRVSARDLGLAALGATATAVVGKLAELSSQREIDPHVVFPKITSAAAKLGATRFATERKKELSEIDRLLEGLCDTRS